MYWFRAESRRSDKLFFASLREISGVLEGRAIPHWTSKTVTPKVKITSRKDAKIAKKTSLTADLGMTEMEMTADSASRDKPTPSWHIRPLGVDVLRVDSARPRALSPQ